MITNYAIQMNDATSNLNGSWVVSAGKPLTWGGEEQRMLFNDRFMAQEVARGFSPLLFRVNIVSVEVLQEEAA